MVASKAPLDLDALGTRPEDPKFEYNGEDLHPVAYPPNLMTELDARAHGITLTDDYAPVENLLAPVARTRGSVKD